MKRCALVVAALFALSLTACTHEEKKVETTVEQPADAAATTATPSAEPASTNTDSTTTTDTNKTAQ